ncbi:hypothetical protein A3A05_02780 [Candidatus Nomurabacteria bacterium RIFCSPLOWO2_01_FULL_41_12]|uniref:Uncharacterized protein n=1 Tax=Candidatus Nomurabacteria bacterium RIFCSPLOWO2_01_FULL_41_12 TaxID=1801774 RepID=A0A1F6WX49_9BACT|nr:MAG: hypothetical protein A3A05_02780 [Candidatus Nomurabacteria bacterium RIFCSPLOWO2_01_FULL_41_12]
MKKIITLLLLVLSVGVFLGYSSYTKESFDYNIAQFIGYLFYWCVALFVVSIFALSIDQKKYKKWMLVSGIYVLISILIAYATGDGNGAIISFDGKDLTLFFAGLYSIISIIYFIVQFFKNRKQSTLV